MSDVAIRIPTRTLAKCAVNACLWFASFLLIFLMDIAAGAGGHVVLMYLLLSLGIGLATLHYKVCRMFGVNFRDSNVCRLLGGDFDLSSLLILIASWGTCATLFGALLGERMFQSELFIYQLMGVVLLHFLGMLVFPIAPSLVIALNRWVDRMNL